MRRQRSEAILSPAILRSNRSLASSAEDERGPVSQSSQTRARLPSGNSLPPGSLAPFALPRSLPGSWRQNSPASFVTVLRPERYDTLFCVAHESHPRSTREVRSALATARQAAMLHTLAPLRRGWRALARVLVTRCVDRARTRPPWCSLAQETRSNSFQPVDTDSQRKKQSGLPRIAASPHIASHRITHPRLQVLNSRVVMLCPRQLPCWQCGCGCAGAEPAANVGEGAQHQPVCWDGARTPVPFGHHPQAGSLDLDLTFALVRAVIHAPQMHNMLGGMRCSSTFFEPQRPWPMAPSQPTSAGTRRDQEADRLVGRPEIILSPSRQSSAWPTPRSLPFASKGLRRRHEKDGQPPVSVRRGPRDTTKAMSIQSTSSHKTSRAAGGIRRGQPISGPEAVGHPKRARSPPAATPAILSPPVIPSNSSLGLSAPQTDALSHCSRCKLRPEKASRAQLSRAMRNGRSRSPPPSFGPKKQVKSLVPRSSQN